MKRYFSLAVMLSLLGIAHPTPAAVPSEPIFNHRDLPAHTRGNTRPSASQVREAILTAGRQVSTVAGSTWRIAETEPGQLIGAISWSQHAAEVTITYSAERYSIVYRGSTNLGYDDERQLIHPTYNRLVRALMFRIQSTLVAVDGDPSMVIPAPASRAAAVAAPAGVEPSVIAFSITANAGTKRSRGWPALVAEWQNHVPAAVQDAGASLLTVREDEPVAMARPGTLVAVHVNYFRFISPARRYARPHAGEMNPVTGSLDVKVQFYDLMTGDPLGSERVYTAAPQAGDGDFAQTTNLQVRNMAYKIMQDWRASAAAQPRTVTSTASDGDRAEVSFWESVRDTKNPAELRAYLEQFPNGKFVPIAKARLAALGEKP